MHSTGWEDCVGGCFLGGRWGGYFFLLPCHMRSSWDLSPLDLISGGWMLLCRELIMAEDGPMRAFYYWSLLYSAILRSWADSLRSHVILHERIAYYSAFLNIHRSGVLTALAWLVPQESAARESQSRRVLCTPYNHAPCHFMQSHIRKVYACLAVTCAFGRMTGIFNVLLR